MNKVYLIGRLTKEPEVRTTNNTTVARYSLAVDRRGRSEETDFISCVAFGKTAEFVERWLHKGSKIAISGRIQTGSYTNRDGKKVYTTDVVIDEHEFCESRGNSGYQDNGYRQQDSSPYSQDIGEGFMSIPEGADDPGLPFN